MAENNIIVCPQCGKKNKWGSKFCMHCQHPLDDTVDESSDLKEDQNNQGILNFYSDIPKTEPDLPIPPLPSSGKIDSAAADKITGDILNKSFKDNNEDELVTFPEISKTKNDHQPPSRPSSSDKREDLKEENSAPVVHNGFSKNDKSSNSKKKNTISVNSPKVKARESQESKFFIGFCYVFITGLWIIIFFFLFLTISDLWGKFL